MDTEDLEKEARKQRLTSFYEKKYAIGHGFSFRTVNYCVEAKNSFINGCFRSCIVSSATAVDQAFRTALYLSKNTEREYWRIKNMEFGAVIAQATKCPSLGKFKADADWLREVRNHFAAHPSYICDYFQLKELKQVSLANRIMVKEMKTLLRFLPRSFVEKHDIPGVGLTRLPSGEIVAMDVTLFRDLAQRFSPERETILSHGNYLTWAELEHRALEEMAFMAYTKMIPIMNCLYLESTPN